MKYSPRCLLAASCLFAASTALATPAWEKSTYTPSTWAAGPGNILSTASMDSSSLSLRAGDNAANIPALLTDGSVPDAWDASQVCTIAGGSLEWTFGTSQPIFQVRLFSR